MKTTAEFSQLPRKTWRDRVGLQVVFSILFVMLLRLPSLGWAVISDDEAIYDAMAQVINSGGVMYRDALDHKPPGLAYVYAAVERLVGAHSAGMLGIQAVHAFGILLTALTVFGLFALARELLKRELWWVPAVLYGIVSSTRCAYDGLALNGEILMNTPTVFAVLAVIWAGKSKGGRRVLLDLSAGALMGLAGLAKWQALVAGLAFPFLGFDNSTYLKRIFQRGPFWLIGLLTPVVGAALYFKSHGVLTEFLQWGGLFNLRYISEGPDLIWALKRLATQLAAVVLPSIVFYAAASYGLFATIRKGWARGPERYAVNAGLFIWAIVSILSVAIGGRFFGHYFLQAELPLCLIAAGPLYRAWMRAPKTIGAAIAIPALFFFAISLKPEATHAIFDAGEPDWERVGQAISRQSKPDDTLFVWGNVPELYHYSQRKMGTRFSFCNYLTGLSPGTRSEYDPSYQPAQVSEAWPLLLQDLQNRRPSIIVDTASAGWKSYAKFGISRYPEFQAFLKAHYRAIDRTPASLGGATLYRRID
ncbi:MAG: ArnT family glycosyltransferase [Bdellovibrionia bacterium]